MRRGALPARGACPTADAARFPFRALSLGATRGDRAATLDAAISPGNLTDRELVDEESITELRVVTVAIEQCVSAVGCRR